MNNKTLFHTLDFDRQLAHLQSVARRSLPRWGLATDSQIELLSLSENATYRITATRGQRPLILRVHRTGYHSLDAIRSELSWMQALQHEAGIATPQALVGADGETVQCIETPALEEERFVVLFHFIDGTAPDENELLAPFRRLGAVTARMHDHARRWQRPAFFERLVWDYDGCLGAVKLWGDWRQGPGLSGEDVALLERADALLRTRLARFGQAPQRFGLIHADLRLANLLETGGDTRVIDFDDAGLGWFLYDLASAVSFIETRDDLPQLIDAWVEGYRSEAALSDAEVAEIPSFILLRRMTLLAWIGSHAETELAQSQGEAFTRGTVELAQRYLQQPAQPSLELQPQALLRRVH